MGLCKNILHSLCDNSYICLRTFKTYGVTFTGIQIQSLIIKDMPGRRPSNFSTGRAFTSKVFRSY